jgi:uncharacterized protein (DUF1330 family)
MTAYLVLTQNVADLQKYISEYVPPVLQLFEKYGVEVLAAQFGVSAMEGNANCVIVLRADSEDVFRALYNDPEYAAPKALRHSITSDPNLLVAPEFAPPD